jgi:hypothetical protein
MRTALALPRRASCFAPADRPAPAPSLYTAALSLIRRG